VVDLHCHVLAGIDDGPQTIDGSVAIARAAAAAGVRTIVATPHVSRRYANQAETIGKLVGELNERLAADALEIRIAPGAEVALTQAIDLTTEQLSALGLGGGPWLLVEPPLTPVASSLDALLLGLQRRGHRIVLAHPERCPAFHGDPQMIGSLVRAGMVTSITAGSLVGRFGSEVHRFALQLAQEDMIHNVASDAHDDTRRPPGIMAELEQSGLGPLAQWLTVEVPGAILAGEEIPPRPALIV
jgi:protein-tyrosine phosphatase